MNIVHHTNGRKYTSANSSDPARCQTRVAGDTSWCATCGNQWSTGDAGPPCPRYGEHDELLALIEQGPKTVMLTREQAVTQIRQLREAQAEISRLNRRMANVSIGAVILGFAAGTAISSFAALLIR